MSDNEDILADDPHGFADDTYNLGDEEEDFLLADDTALERSHHENSHGPVIQDKHKGHVITNNIPKEQLCVKPVVVPLTNKEPACAPAVRHDLVPQARPLILNTREKSNKAAVIPVGVTKPSMAPPKVAAVPPQQLQTNNKPSPADAPSANAASPTDTSLPGAVTEDERYRAGQRERFPTERADKGSAPGPVHKSNATGPTIPDSLDSVVTADVPQQNFRGGRRGNQFRGDKRAQAHQRQFQRDRHPQRDHRRDNFRPPPNFNHHFMPPDDFRPREFCSPPRDLGPFPGDFHPHFDEIYPNMEHPDDFRPLMGDFPNRPGNFRQHPGDMRVDMRFDDMRPGDMRFRDMRPGDMRPGDMRPGDMRPGDMRPGDMRPGDMRPGDMRRGDMRHGPNMRFDDMQPDEILMRDMRSGDMRPGDMRPGDMRPGDMRPGNMRSGDLRPDDMRPGNMRPGDMRPGDMRPGDMRLDDMRLDDMRLGDMRPGDMRPGDMRPDDMRPGNMRPGDLHPGDFEQGQFRPNVRNFNHPQDNFRHGPGGLSPHNDFRPLDEFRPQMEIRPMQQNNFNPPMDGMRMNDNRPPPPEFRQNPNNGIKPPMKLFPPNHMPPLHQKVLHREPIRSRIGDFRDPLGSRPPMDVLRGRDITPSLMPNTRNLPDLNQRPPMGDFPPPFEGSKPNFPDGEPPQCFFDRRLVQGSDLPPNLPPRIEGKKVLINPHFKGTVQTTHDILLQQPPPLVREPISMPPPNFLGGYVQDPYLAGPPPPLSQDLKNNIRRPIGEVYPRTEPEYSPPEGTVSEEALERLAEQFINEQWRCLQKAKTARNDDFFEKTQRFIENTSIEVRPVEPIADRRDEDILRKQEDFIQQNRLNMRRRRTSPLRQDKRTRMQPKEASTGSASALSPGDPEEREYRQRLREQADMRARVLQAKERRRRRDATTSIEEAKQKNTKTTPPRRTDKDNSTTAPPRAPADSPPLQANHFDLGPSKPTGREEVAVNPESVNRVEPAKPQQRKPELKAENVNENNIVEYLDDYLDDDALHLAPEDEDFLLNDLGEGTTPPPKSKDRVAAVDSRSDKTAAKEKAKAVDKSKPGQSLKRSSTENRQDLRNKLVKHDAAPAPPAQEAKAPAPSTPARQTAPAEALTPPRRKIIYSGTAASQQAQQNSLRGDKADQPSNKWRSTFTEQKLERTAPIAARAISAAIRPNNEPPKRKVIPTSQATKAIRGETDSGPEEKAADKGIFSGRRVVVGGQPTNNRVVLPRRKQPLVVVETEDDGPEPYEEEPSAKEAKGKVADRRRTAIISGLPPGMTEARLLSLCGPEVESVSLGGGGGAAEASFTSAAACQRFVRRFHGRIVAACSLDVRHAS